MSGRDAVRMSAAEIARFLDEPRTLNVATVGPDGAIHIVAMWFVVRDGCPAFTTYGKSQKVANLRRDPRLSGLVEGGESYDRLRGVEMIGRGRIIEEPDEVVRLVGELSEKYGMGHSSEQIARTAAKRVGIVLEPERIISWDHAKLAAATQTAG
jgi:PPOX class probable F420-dependent enzyme